MRSPWKDADDTLVRASEYSARRMFTEATLRKRSDGEIEFWFRVGQTVDEMCDEGGAS
jgi:hypothetical protein